LGMLGYDVRSVAGGAQAVQYLRDHPVDLLVLDMIMDPGIDGLETYRQILEIKPGQKAIITSGYSETNNVKATMALGAGAYIRKPYLLEAVGKAVRAELDSD
jgi:two-component system cell cycle sensor histidine kinase/response regulator CckA